MAELAELSQALSSDSELFRMYMDALDAVLAAPEVRSSFDEFGLSAGLLRLKMVGDAQRVLGTAAPEFAAYEAALAEVLSARALDLTMTSEGRHRGVARLLRSLTRRVLGAELAGELLRAVPWNFGSEVAVARDRLMAAISATELLAEVRTFINTARQRRFGHAYTVVSSPALSEVYESSNRIPTEIEAELAALLGRLDGASIGVAGPRGAGKSTLVRGHCEAKEPAADGSGGFRWSFLLGSALPERSWGDLRCVVAAPVEYVPREFVLHLFAAFCGSVIVSYRSAARFRGALLSAFWLRRILRICMSLAWYAAFYGSYAAILLYFDRAIARQFSVPAPWVQFAAIALIVVGAADFARLSASRMRPWVREARSSRASGKSMVAAAREHLSRVRYLQTYTSGWSGGLTLPGGAGTQFSGGVSRAEQPLSYPEIVAEFRNFTSSVAADVHLRGDRVFIGIDELDKMGSAEQAEHFLNEIKGIFGVPHLYFMVSVSDDAINSFERRGLPLRDAFDSSFDQILRVEPLTYHETRRLLYRRVIGLTEPYVAFCHCLAGGLARDVIRAARQVARSAASLTPGRSSPGADDGRDISEFKVPTFADPPQQPPSLSAISAAVLYDELHGKLRAISQVTARMAIADTADLQVTLHDAARHLAVGQPIIDVVDLLAKPGHAAPDAVTHVRLDLATYSYFCATLQEVFTDRLDDMHMVKATNNSSEPGSFDSLAEARNAFTTDTLLAWRLITRCRQAWSLQPRDPPGHENGPLPNTS